MRPIRILASIAVFASTAACGSSALDVARSTIATGALAVREVTDANREAMAATMQRDLDASDTAQEFTDKRAAFYRLEEAGRVARGALLFADNVLETADAEDVGAVILCVVDSLVTVMDAIGAVDDIPGVDLPIPAELANVVTWARRFDGRCVLEGS